MAGCHGTKYLPEGQRLLIDQKIKGAGNTDLEGLENAYTQKTASRLSLTTRLYQWGEKQYKPAKYQEKAAKIEARYDKKIAQASKAKKKRKLNEKKINKAKRQKDKVQFGNTLMQWGKPLAIYDKDQTEITTNNIRNRLHSEGYFNNTVEYVERLKKKKAYVTYQVTPRNPYAIDSVNFIIPDERVRKLVTANSLIRKGNRYRQADLTAERDRIRNLLSNNGYYAFSRQYVNFQVDSTVSEQQNVMVNVRVTNPKGSNGHKVYQLDSVIFVSDTDAKTRVKRRQKTYNHITYDYLRDIYSSKILDWRIFIYPDSVYSEEKTFETQKQLSNINNFKFINVKYDTTGGDFIAHIFTSPLKRFETSSEVGINSREGLPGPFINFGLVNRNSFEGLENIDLNFNLEVIGLRRFNRDDSGNDEVYDSYEYGGNINFSFPQFLIPFNSAFKAKLGKYNPITKVSAGITFLDRQDFARNTFNTSITYNWQTNNNTRYGFTPADINFIRADLNEDFQNDLDSLAERGNTFARSFDPGFVSSTIFTFTKDIKEYGNVNRPSSFLRGYAELGGNITNLFGGSLFGEEVSLYRYLKASLDYRHHIPLGKKTAIAFRFNSGFAYPFGGENNNTLPYEKFFFAGGSNSIKAWQPRRLGPGSYREEDDNDNISYQVEQPGEVIIESGFELRTKLFGFLSWGWFIDAGNVWTWNEDKSRRGSNFDLRRFASEIAVGSGMGLRLDFSFLLVRVDLGIKVFDPAQDPGDRFVLDDFSFSGPGENARNVKVINTPQLNIGIGYPF